MDNTGEIVTIQGKMFSKSSCEAAVLFLAGHCDGAATQDGQGFSKYDAAWGHSCAEKALLYGVFSVRMLAALQADKAKGAKHNGLILKYRKQLEAGGFNIDALLDQSSYAEPKPEPLMIEVHGHIVKQAASGLAVLIDPIEVCGKSPVWLPLSKVTRRGFYHVGTKENGSQITVFDVPDWMAEARGLSMYVGREIAYNAAEQAVSS